MSLLYVFISMAAATIGAISPQATNIAVIKPPSDKIQNKHLKLL